VTVTLVVVSVLVVFMSQRMTIFLVRSNSFLIFFRSVEHSARRGTFHLEMKLDFFLKKSLTGGAGPGPVGENSPLTI